MTANPLELPVASQLRPRCHAGTLCEVMFPRSADLVIPSAAPFSISVVAPCFQEPARAPPPTGKSSCWRVGMFSPVKGMPEMQRAAARSMALIEAIDDYFLQVANLRATCWRCPIVIITLGQLFAR